MIDRNAGQDSKPADAGRSSEADDERVGTYALGRALDSMREQAEFSLLGDVWAVARAWYGFRGSIEDAKQLLQSSGSFNVEERHPAEECRVARAR